MTNEELRILDELKKTHRQMELQKARTRRRKSLRFLAVLIMVALVVIPGASALYVSELSLLQPRGLDSVTNTELFDAFYPVGAIYQTTADIDPGDIFGGNWAQIEGGRTLLGAGAGFTAGGKGGGTDTDYTTPPATLTGSVSDVGGSVSLTGTVSAVGANAALSGTASGIGGPFSLNFTHTLTVAQMPAHTHNVPAHAHPLDHSHPYAGPQNTSGWPDNSSRTSSNSGDNYSYWTGNGSTTTSSNSTGNGLTAAWGGNTGNTGSGTAFTFTNTGTASGFGGIAGATIPAAGWSGTAAASGTVFGLTGNVSVSSSGLADKTMQPYVVVYIWERVS